jgi:hypothetical protein
MGQAVNKRLQVLYGNRTAGCSAGWTVQLEKGEMHRTGMERVEFNEDPRANK